MNHYYKEYDIKYETVMMTKSGIEYYVTIDAGCTDEEVFDVRSEIVVTTRTGKKVIKKLSERNIDRIWNEAKECFKNEGVQNAYDYHLQESM